MASNLEALLPLMTKIVGGDNLLKKQERSEKVIDKFLNHLDSITEIAEYYKDDVVDSLKKILEAHQEKQEKMGGNDTDKEKFQEVINYYSDICDEIDRSCEKIVGLMENTIDSKDEAFDIIYEIRSLKCDVKK